VQLARHWRTGLHVVHAVDALQPSIPVGVNAEAYLQSWPDPKPQARRRLAALVEDAPATLHIEDGPPTQAILAVAEREACDLIVLGEGRDRVLGPLESTLDEVIRKAAASVLVVRSRPARPYRQLVVGTDYTDEALQALVRATSLFPEAAITFVHAHATPYAGLRGDRVPDQAWIEQERAKLQAHLDAANVAPWSTRAIKLQVEAGPPAAVLPKCIAESSADLAVIGAHPRGLVYDTVLGSTRLIVEAIPGDILVVRAVRRDG
jgi:nucleotide-binding universal stress UspA family protein